MLTNPPPSRVRATRVDGDGLTVNSRTIGTEVAFRFQTRNISRSGLLISAESRHRHVPFRVNTIIEMDIDPEGSLFGEPVQCLGKVVREEGHHHAADAKYGVRIVQIDNDALQAWEEYVQGLEDGDVPRPAGLHVSHGADRPDVDEPKSRRRTPLVA